MNGFFLAAKTFLEETSDDILGLKWYYWLIIIAAVTGLMIFMNFYRRKKYNQQVEEVKQKLVVGAKILTVGGIVGTIVEVDDKAGTMVLEVAPDNVKLSFVKESLHSIFKNKKEEEAEAVISYDDDTDKLFKPSKTSSETVVNYDDDKGADK